MRHRTTDRWDRWVAWLDAHRPASFAALALLFALGLAGMLRVGYDPDVLVYFDPEGADRRAFQAVEDRFGRDNEIVFLLRAPPGAVLTPDGLGALAALEREARLIAGATSVESVLGLVPDPSLLPDAVRAAGEGVRPLIAADASVAAVAATIGRSTVNDADVAALADAARAARERVAPDLPTGFDVLLTGRIVIDDAFRRAGGSEMNAQVGLQVVVIALVLVLALRSLALAGALMALTMVATVLALGVVGWAGWTLNGVSSATPAVLLGVGIATGVHVAMAWQEAMRGEATALARGSSRAGWRRAAVAAAMRENAAPVALSILTTLVSFLALNLAASPPFRQLGNVVAMGLAITLALAFVALPLLLLVLPCSTGEGRAGLERAMAALGRLTVRRRRALLALAALVTVLAAAGCARLTFDDVFSHYFDERYEVRRATDLFEEKLAGTTQIYLSLPLAGEGTRDDARDRVTDLADWLRIQPAVSVVTGPDEDPGRSLDAGAENARVEVVLRGVSSADTLRFAAAVERRAVALFGEGVIVTGLPILSARLSTESARTMMVATALALVVISLVLLRTLGSLRLGLVSLVPNLLPMLVAFGLWGVLVGEVSFAATTVAALTFGIVVDDTVHVLLKYRRARRGGLPPAEAVVVTMRRVGLALVVTSVAIGAGFATFALSGFLVNQHFGALSALTLGAALLADLLLLPPLLLLADRDRAGRQGREGSRPPPPALRPPAGTGQRGRAPRRAR